MVFSGVRYSRASESLIDDSYIALLSADVLASLGLIAALVAVRIIVGHALRRRSDSAPQMTRRWAAATRNVLLLVGLLGLIMIWAPQLRTFALSLTAVAVAIVVATKELLLCLSGAALRAFSRSFSVGDRIEIAGLRGEVLDHDWLVTRLQEFEDKPGSFRKTGRVVSLPNSILFTAPIRMEGRSFGELLHRFTMTVEPDINIFAEREAIEQLAENACTSVTSGSAGNPVSVQFGTSEIGKYQIEFAVRAAPEKVDALQEAVFGAVGNYFHKTRAAQRAESEGRK